MISFPLPYIATRYPGYFWNIEDKHVYSIKRGGVLRPLKPTLPSKWNNFSDSFRISHEGKSRYMTLPYLNKLKLCDDTFPEWNLPKQLTDDDIIGVVGDLMATNDYLGNPVKYAMSVLRKDFDGRYDQHKAIEIITDFFRK